MQLWPALRKHAVRVASTAASMLLAGVVMKLGSYACLRAAMLLCPAGLEYWKWWVAWIAVIGIVYGAAVAFVQKDFKLIIGYSSVSHMGFVLLGLATLNLKGMSGAILQMFSHGIIAGLLMVAVGGFWFIPATRINLMAHSGAVSAAVWNTGTKAPACR